jgi:DNA-binding CsgD family transcriptional regulator
MKLNPEIKQLRKEKRSAVKVIAKQTEELEYYRKRIIRIRQKYYEFFVGPIFETEILTPREKKILEMRFGFIDGKCMTYEAVAREFDVTRERIRQLEAKALEKISWTIGHTNIDYNKICN